MEDVKKKGKVGKIVFYLFVVVVIALIAGTVYFVQKDLTGNLILGIETTYAEDEALQGVMSFSLKEGELLPSSTIVSISVGDEVHEYPLSELIDSEVVSGDFYVDGKSVSGSGAGYGVVGIDTIYPDVGFTMRVSKSGGSVGESGVDSGSSGDGDSGSESSESVSEETTGEETTSEEEATGETGEGETATSEEETTTEETGGEETTIESSESVSEESSSESESSSSESSESSDSGSDSGSDSDEVSGGSIITGSVVAQLGVDIDGVVNVQSPFSYQLDSSGTVSIVDSEHDVELNVVNGVAIVTTDYSEEVEGFGEGFLGEYGYELEIDFESLGIIAEEGDLVVSLGYGGEEIASVSTVLSVESPESSATAMTEPEEVSNVTEVVEVPEIEVENIADYVLSDEELFILKGETGVESASIGKAQKINERFLVRFEVGDYWLENSYDGAISEDDLRELVELDRVKFAKRLANVLLVVEDEGVELEGFVGTADLMVGEEDSSDISGDEGFEEEVVEEEIVEVENQ
ncbi:hypothetical protein CMI46_03030 [Candidatus Pacearchaeota archaeon]|nr:hypothetical protein [Candidatus Pacearchaeota archaeon]|tara:strand:+ start:8376 stop:9941 length:1566 start_codon:yes stop_codon:yes gene_type:complete